MKAGGGSGDVSGVTRGSPLIEERRARS